MTDTAVATIPPLDSQTRLTGQQQRVLRTLLVDRLQAHLHRGEDASDALDEFTASDPPHEREAARSKLQTILDAIREHEDALSRFDAGTYGACAVCAQAIPFERLEAIPEVNHCVSCTRVG